ncbi:MAG: efflux RND transporter permease subunit [Cellulomonadaceae bacterium]
MSLLARFSLANRALISLITVALALLGTLSMTSLKQELIPSLQIPVAIVLAPYPGTSPEIVEDVVTAPIEEAVRGVDGVETISSSSATGLSLTTVELVYGTNLDRAAQQLETAVGRVRAALPDAVDPTVVTGSIDDLPVVQLAVTAGADTDPAELTAQIENTILPRLDQVPDVRSATVSGISANQVLITPDLAALAALGLGPSAVSDAIDASGVVLPAGSVTQGDLTLSVQAGTALAGVDDFQAIILTGADGTRTTLGEVADVVYGPGPATSLSRLDGDPALAIAVTKTPAGNTVEVSDAVGTAIEELGETLPGTRIAVVFDQASFITESIEGLATEGALGLVFAVVVILAFLMSVRSTLVSAISIPLSLCVTFIAMNATGYTLNILTLGAMTVAIGRVVDDSIVVIENIKRHLSYGEHKRTAIIGAVREVAGAVTSSTVCTVVVFAPIAFVGGAVGELFRPFAVTVSLAMLASLFVALTIVPVLAYWFVREPILAGDEAAEAEARAVAEAKERRGLWQRAYVPSLRTVLTHPVVTLVVAVAILGGTVALVPRLETNFLGDSGQNTLTVTSDFAPATSLEVQDAAAQRVEQALAADPEVRTVQSTVGTGSGVEAVFSGALGAPRATFAVTLEHDADATAVQQRVRSELDELEDVGTVSIAGADAAFGSSTVDLVVRSADLDALSEAAAQVTDAVTGMAGVAQVSNDLAAAQPYVQITVDPQRAADAGLSEAQVVGVAAAAMSPADVGSADLGDGPVRIRMQVGQVPVTLEEVQAIPVPTAAGPVALSDVADVVQTETSTTITRVDGERSATVAVTPAGQDLGTLSGELDRVVEGLDLPAGTRVEVAGAAAEQADAFADLGLALVAAIAIVYIVMVATFRSLAQPFILLVSVPFAATGALVLLLVTGTPLGVPALIGALMLIGVVVANAIVLIDLINQYRDRGRGLDEAIAEGARKRLRPIVMTAFATIFALTPMALGITGGGSFISRPLALVVIGGLVSSTFLTLLVVPVLYHLIEGAKERRAAHREQRRADKAAALRSERGGSDGDTASGNEPTITSRHARHAAPGEHEGV